MPYTTPTILVALFTLLMVAPGTLGAPPNTTTSRARLDGEILPVLKKYCADCHSGAKPEGEVLLDGNSPSWFEDRKLWAKVARNLKFQYMPPPDNPKPSDREVNTILQWVATRFPYDPANKSPGRVTMRRLNRVEYNNTVRDLFGISFRPADDFPSDDVGYGFDNIGDVLSLPPLLLEKYLDAAEKIAEEVIQTTPPGSPTEQFGPKALAGDGVASRGVRTLITNGECWVDFQFPHHGDYVVRVVAWENAAGKEPAEMAIKMDGKTIKTVKVSASAEEPGTYMTRTSLRAGKRRVAVAFNNDFYDPNAADRNRRDRNLHVKYLEISGPLHRRLDYPAAHRRVMIATPKPGKSPQVCAREIFSALATRAYRRPVKTEELDALVRVVNLALAEKESFERAIQLGIQAMLVSPHFLFRVELDPGDAATGEYHPLNQYQVASRLSYFLWSSMPDDELLGMARDGQLRQPKIFQEKVERMLRDYRVRALVENFGGQWLNIRNLDNVNPHRRRFPMFGEELRKSMRMETELFLLAIIREDRSLLDILQADFTFVNERLAFLYGIKGIEGHEFQRVKLDGTQRGGILTQASVLTVTSNPTRTSPVKRGKWVLENLLGTPPPPPPPMVPELREERRESVSRTLRQRMEKHRADATCASCHARMDPIGFGLENFDGIGEWRTHEGRFLVDSSGILPDGRKFNGPSELRRVLLEQKDDFTRCFIEKLLTYALGRGLDDEDSPMVEHIARRVAEQNYKFSSVVLEIVKSDPFLYRGVKK